MYECSTIRDLTYAKAVLSVILGCRESDTPEIFRLCSIHGSGVIEATKGFIDANPWMNWSFAAFVEGVYITVLNEIKDLIPEAQFETLQGIRPDYKTDAWFAKDGGIADRGNAFCNEASIFEDMCRYGVNFDRIEALKEAGQVIE